MPNKDQESLKLATAHYDVEPGMLQIFRLRSEPATESQQEEPIKLLEVNEDTIAAGVMPLGFGPLPEYGINFPSVIVEVTPAEYEQIRQKSLPLPLNWSVGELLPRPSAGAVA
jgi:hypothetical protein